MVIGLGMGLMAIGDGIYLFQAAKGTYVEGTLLDALWPAAALMVGAAAWQPTVRRAAQRIEGWRVVAIPFAAGMSAVDAMRLVSEGVFRQRGRPPISQGWISAQDD